MKRNDYYLGISLILMVLCLGFHLRDYTLLNISDIGLFARENTVLFILFLISLIMFNYNLVLVIRNNN